jgi:hypothetical protein
MRISMKKCSYLFGFVVLAAFTVQGYAQSPSGAATTPQNTEAAGVWMKDLALRHQQLMVLNGPGTNAALRDRLLKDAVIDQEARTSLLQEAKRTGTPPDLTKLHPTDAKLTTELKEIVASAGWPTIHLVGLDASNAAMLILTHTEDHVWQEALLPKLEQLSVDGKIDGSQLALVVDKQLVSAGKLQRYGTQFKFDDGHMAMYAVESPEALDVRRASAMLPPIDAYKQMLSTTYSMPTSNDVISAPAKP